MNNNAMDTSNVQNLQAESLDQPNQNALMSTSNHEILNVHQGANRQPNIVDYNQEDYPIGVTS